MTRTAVTPPSDSTKVTLGADTGVLAVAVIWGSSYGIMQLVTDQGVNASLFLALRFGAAVIPLVALSAHKISQLTRYEVAFGLVYGTLLFTILTLETTGVQHTSAANAGFLITCSVVLVPVFERVLGGQRRPPLLYAMTILGIAGCGIMAFSDGRVHLRAGDWLILGAALVRAFQIYYSGNSQKQRGADSLRVTLIALSLVTAASVVVAPFYGRPIGSQLSGLDSSGWLLIAYLGVLGTAYAFGIQLYAVGVTSPTRVAIILSTEPVFAAIFAVVIRHETLHWTQCFGGILIIFAAFGGRIIEART